MLIQGPAIPTPPELPGGEVIVRSLPPWMTLPPQVTVIIALAFFAACAVVLYPLMRAIGRRLEGRRAAEDPALGAEVDRLSQRLAEVEALQHRVMELEERVDFAERLLANQRQPGRLPGDAGGGP